ncbi:MAG: hypothetical protein EON88_03185 [Brevundimonas sp.]|nr:MAG: hypothetical protein EON88_03185 [Brevundimonas sp.]
MNRMISVAVATLIASTLPQIAAAQPGNGNGNGHGAERGHGGGPRAERSRDENRGHGRDNDGKRGQERAERPNGGPMRAARPDDRRDPRPQQRAERRDDRRGPRPEAVRVIERQVVAPDRTRIVFRDRVERRVIDGCPPGLAKRDNGCLPPGLARQVDRARDYDRYDRYRYVWNVRDANDYRYRDGYLYRTNAQGGLLGYLPVLGGALWTGNTWPAQYNYEPAPAYYSQYYGLQDRNAYRYADGVLYGVNPQNQSITQVAALLTGQNWTVGQPMPAGYDVYNVPYAYRNQYADGPQSMYRYSDGYVYQVDPTTQLVQTVIQLLT